MNDLSAKLMLLNDALDKKIELLNQILNITQNQEMFFNTLSGDERDYMLKEARNEKQNIINELVEIDDMFISMFESFGGKLNQNQFEYKNEIASLQNKIRKITDIDVSIRVKEERNRRLMDAGAINVKPIKALKASKSYMLNQYNKNSSINKRS